MLLVCQQPLRQLRQLPLVTSCSRRILAASYNCRRYSSSFRDRNSDNDGSNNDQSNQGNNKLAPENKGTIRTQSPERLSFMPVINMPEAEFAHNAFFSLHRPLLGLSLDEERSFFSQYHQRQPPNRIQKMLGIQPQQPVDEQSEQDDEVAQYMMQLRPFEPPNGPAVESESDQDQHQGTTVTVSFEDGSSLEDFEGLSSNHTLPMYYMPDSEEVVDYLKAIQDKLQLQGYTNGRRRRMLTVPALLARKRAMLLQQQYRQRSRRERVISRLLLDRRHCK